MKLIIILLTIVNLVTAAVSLYVAHSLKRTVYIRQDSATKLMDLAGNSCEQINATANAFGTRLTMKCGSKTLLLEKNWYSPEQEDAYGSAFFITTGGSH